MSAAFGVTIKQQTIDDALLTGPGEDLVIKLIQQMASVRGFTDIFGPYSFEKGALQRWADYQRFDWSIRQLPAINVFEGNPELKDSDQAFLNGSITIQVFWPPNFRRPDNRRVEAAFKGTIENFFSSKFASDMLDELYWIARPMKVYGLNQLGKSLTWTPNAEGVVESQLVPVSIFDIPYRIDLRAWYRALEFQGRTKDNPFERTLEDLVSIDGEIDGVKNKDPEQVEIVIESDMPVANP